jgi:hypothetical protein
MPGPNVIAICPPADRVDDRVDIRSLTTTSSAFPARSIRHLVRMVGLLWFGNIPRRTPTRARYLCGGRVDTATGLLMKATVTTMRSLARAGPAIRFDSIYGPCHGSFVLTSRTLSQKQPAGYRHVDGNVYRYRIGRSWARASRRARGECDVVPASRIARVRYLKAMGVTARLWAPSGPLATTSTT